MPCSSQATYRVNPGHAVNKPHAVGFPPSLCVLPYSQMLFRHKTPLIIPVNLNSSPFAIVSTKNL